MKAVTEALKRQLRIEEAAIYANQIERYSRTSFAGYECLPLHPERPEYIEELKAAIAVLESTPAEDWVKVEDGLPEVGQYVECYLSERGFSPIEIVISKYTVYGFESASNITHWRNLPSPPKKINHDK